MTKTGIYRQLTVALVLCGSLLLGQGSARSELLIQPSGGVPEAGNYDADIQTAIWDLDRSPNPYLRQLAQAARSAPARIVIAPQTHDRRTWHRDGNAERGHTEPADGQPKKLGRTAPTGATVFVHPTKIGRGSRGGLLVHELVHAVDLAYGRYHPNGIIRERRAVFMQNLWFDMHGLKLRASYHHKFATDDYHHARASGRVAEYVQHILTRSDLPQR